MASTPWTLYPETTSSERKSSNSACLICPITDALHSPFFDKVKIQLPGAEIPLEIHSEGAPKKPYIKSAKVNGKSITNPVISHVEIAKGAAIEFEMSSNPEGWASGTIVSVSFADDFCSEPRSG